MITNANKSITKNADKDLKKLAIWKFSSCDGCQLSLLDCEDELLLLTEKIRIAHFAEATTTIEPGPYDLSLVEGSITTPDEVKRIQEVRAQSKYLITIGACATTGGIQALRNYGNLEEITRYVYPKPEFINSLATSTGIHEHVKVDFELRGCPVNKLQLLEVILAFVNNRKPNIPNESVCSECKRRGNVCITVTDNIPCLGPVTHAGCGGLCPAYSRGCFGCFGPKENPNMSALIESWQAKGVSNAAAIRLLRTFNTWAPPNRSASEELEPIHDRK